MSLALLILLLVQDVPLPGIIVPDVELAQQRGGFMLPNGIDVALTVQTQTSINGAIVLRSIFRADQGPATLTVYAPKAGETIANPTAQVMGGSAATPTITYDGRGGLQVSPGAGPSIAVTSAVTIQQETAGLQQVGRGTGAITDNGVISQTNTSGLQTADLRSADLSITHLAGTAFGSAIANSGSDRAIDTTTAVGINLSNVDSTVLASAMLRIEDVATSAMQARQ